MNGSYGSRYSLWFSLTSKLLGFPAFPVSRPALVVGHGYQPTTIPQFSVKDRVRKPPKHEWSNRVLVYRIALWFSPNGRCSSLEFLLEIQPQSPALPLVILDSGEILLLGLPVEDERLHGYFSRASANT